MGVFFRNILCRKNLLILENILFLYVKKKYLIIRQWLLILGSKVLMTRVLCFIFFISNGCVTYDSSFNTGNVLKPGLSNHGLSLHYLVSHEEDVTQKRLKGDESTQRFKSSENIGIGYHFRYGIYKDFEFGTQVSFDFSSVDGTYNLINHEKLAISLQSKLLFPTFSFDEPKSYELGLFFPSSYRLKKLS